jgi:NADPH-dependent curcumin reductase CurA
MTEFVSSSTSKDLFLKESIDFGLPGPEHFEVKESTVDSSSMVDGDIFVKIMAISADPYLRNSIKKTAGPMNAGSNKQGDIMQGFVSGKVLASKNPNWIVGDLFGAHSQFSTVQIISKDVAATFRKLTGMIDESQISLGVGVLGMPGSTAYGGLLDVLRPLKGETIFVSSASGAVGGLVGMIAKNVFGCKVIGMK